MHPSCKKGLNDAIAALNEAADAQREYIVRRAVYDHMDQRAYDDSILQRNALPPPIPGLNACRNKGEPRNINMFTLVCRRNNKVYREDCLPPGQLHRLFSQYFQALCAEVRQLYTL